MFLTNNRWCAEVLQSARVDLRERQSPRREASLEAWAAHGCNRLPVRTGLLGWLQVILLVKKKDKSVLDGELRVGTSF